MAAPGVGSSRFIVSLGVRPARVAVLVPCLKPLSHLALFEAALAAQARTWGGHGNLFFPLTPDMTEQDLFWELAELFDPDTFVVYSPTYEDTSEIDPRWHREYIRDVHAKFVREVGASGADDLIRQLESHHVFNGRLEPSMLDVLKRRLAPFHRDSELWHVHDSCGSAEPSYPLMDATEFAEIPRAITNRTTTAGVAARLLLTANLGRLTKSAIGALRDRGVDVAEVRLKDRLTWANAAVERERPPGAHAPWTIAETGVAYYRPREFSEVSALVVGDSPWDFALYYALKRMTGQAWWLPSWLRRNQNYMWRLMHDLEFGPAREGKKLVVTTASSTRSRDDIAAGLTSLHGGKVNADIAPWRDVLPKEPLRLFERDNLGRSESVELVDGHTLPLQTPVPRRVSTTPESHIRWLTELHSPMWRPVRHAALGVEFLQTPVYDSEQVRTSREGLVYFCPHVILLGNESLGASVVRPTVSPMSLLGQVERIAQAVGWRVALSDKGIYATESAKLFGGTQELATALRNPIVRKILEAFVAKSGPGQLLSSDSRRYLSWKNLEGIVSEAEIAGHVSPLLDARILERGLILQCARCRQKGWYDLERISDAFRCSRCRLTQPVEARWGSTPEPPWFYGLAEVLRQFLAADGDLPVLAVHDAFGGIETTQQTFELDLSTPQGKSFELDIFASEGSRLWVGEANRSGEFDTMRIQGLVETARTFDAYGILLATSKVRWPSSTTSAVESVMSGISHPVIKLLQGVK